MRDRGGLDEYQIVAIGALIFTAVIVFSFFFNAAQQRNEVTPAEKKPTEQELIARRYCGDVVRSCEFSLDEKTRDCNADSAKARVEAIAADPLKSKECEKAEDELMKSCPEGCDVDYGSLIRVPGKIKFDFFDKPDESGRCQIRATRVVTMKASCLRRRR